MENAYTEYKRELTDGLEKEVVAFLNTLGGEILIGVEDNGEVVGIDDPDDISLKVADRLKNNISPSVIGLFQIDILGEQKKYIKISVAGGLEKPYYIKKYGMSPKGCFVRIGTQSTPMEQAQIETLFSHRVNRTLSTIISPRQDLTFTQLRIFYEENGFDTSGDHFFRNLGMYTSDGRFNYFAMLLSDQNDVTMKVARFKGTDKNEIITSKEFILVPTWTIITCRPWKLPIPSGWKSFWSIKLPCVKPLSMPSFTTIISAAVRLSLRYTMTVSQLFLTVGLWAD